MSAHAELEVEISPVEFINKHKTVRVYRVRFYSGEDKKLVREEFKNSTEIHCLRTSLIRSAIHISY